MRFAFIGCGGIAHGHIDKLLRRKQEVVALFDPNPESISRLLNRFPALQKAKVYDSEDELLEKEKLDAVVIASPHTCHYEQIIKSLEHNLNVFVEKPMVCATSHAERVVELAEEKGLTVMVGYQRHFMPAFLYAKECIKSGGIGRVLFVSAFQAQNWLPAALHSWRGDPALSGGGQINDSGSHLIDIILWLTELKPLEVFAYMDNEETRVDILSSLAIKFEGALGNVGIIGDNPSWNEEVVIFGKEGSLIIRNAAEVIQQGKDGKFFQPENLPQGTTPIDAFVDCLEGKRPNEVPPIWGLRVISLTEAAWQSAREGKPVPISVWR